MMNNILPINWIDGMKINKSHFIHNDKLLNYQLQQRTVILMKSYEYGLLPLHNSKLSKPIVTLEDSRLIVNHCEAVNRRGDLLSIDDYDQLDLDLRSLNKELLKDGNRLIVILSKSTRSQVEFGEPIEGELPPRQPFVKPKYELIFVEEDKISTEEFVLNYVCLARLIINNGQVQIDTTYIPPCNQIYSHQELVNRYNVIEHAISEIELNAAQVVQNARAKKKRGEINDLAENTFYVMEKIVFFLGQHMNNIRTIYKEESPVILFSFLNSFGRIIITALKCLKSEDKEALLRYYESHLGLHPHQFESDMNELGQIKYSHLSITNIFDIVEQHIVMLKSFASKATQLEFHSVERVDVLTESTVVRKKLDIF